MRSQRRIEVSTEFTPVRELRLLPDHLARLRALAGLSA